MSRLIDRIRAHGISPLSLSLATGGPPTMDEALDVCVGGLLDLEGRSEDVARAELREHFERTGIPDLPVGPRPPTTMFDDLPVFAADDVAAYTELVLGPGTDLLTHLASLAPPYDQFWVDINRRHHIDGWPPIHAWGVLFTVRSHNEDEDLRWNLRCEIYVEFDKNKPVVGPVFAYFLGLAEDGSIYRMPDDGAPLWSGRICRKEEGDGVNGEKFFEISPVEGKAPTAGTGDPERHARLQSFNELLAPAALAVSFLHCTNVETQVVEPPEKLSRKFERRHGTPLARYVVLDVEPMRRILTEAGGTSESGLARALHTCRGHFKTFAEDAPLFGRFTGTWWWAPQVRGAASSGQVLKDYRVHPTGFGAEWRDEDESMPAAPEPADPDDPDKAGRGRVEHASTVNALARAVTAAGLTPVRAGRDEPDFDLGFLDDDGTPWVVEVKSIHDANEEHQLRLGLGQVLRYRQRLAAAGHDGIRAVLAVSRPVTDQSWVSGCELDGVTLVDPTNWTERLEL